MNSIESNVELIMNLRTVPRSIFVWFVTKQKKQIITRAIENQKNNWGNHAFLGITILKKTKILSNVRRFFSKFKLYYL